MQLSNLKYPGIAILAILVVLSLWMDASAQAGAAQRKDAAGPWTVSLETKYFFQSHTSYEFGNPFPPYQTPLSRLEFPLNSWWAGASLRREFSRFSVGVEVFRNLSGEAEGKMMDSDWDDEERPVLKTIYSDSSCRMEQSYIVSGDVDLKIADWLGLPKWLDLRPAAGLTWQRFSLVTHDGVQYNLTPEGITTTPLPGDGIAFRQTYWQFFVGFKTLFDLGKPLRLAGLKIETQLDWAYVAGDNEDHHLLRAGNRLTQENTTGEAWHALVNLKIGLTSNLNATLCAEYRRIATTGSHRLVNETFGVDFKFYHGVKVWSEQTSITMGLEYTF
ncbi:MAG: omptin family outer membrane protease [Deltaproteobacteria bacterium]|nr:omptin family outer membrane protease [Deltaproteobacteria bacterium]